MEKRPFFRADMAGLGSKGLKYKLLLLSHFALCKADTIHLMKAKLKNQCSSASEKNILA